jgi:hypothetical protein
MGRDVYSALSLEEQADNVEEGKKPLISNVTGQGAEKVILSPLPPLKEKSKLEEQIIKFLHDRGVIADEEHWHAKFDDGKEFDVVDIIRDFIIR